MLDRSVKSFLKKQEKKPEVQHCQNYHAAKALIEGQIVDYHWHITKLNQATKNKNTEAVVKSIDNKYMPEFKENKAVQINRLQAQVERLKSTSEALKFGRPSNSRKPVPIKL